jgi:cell division protease FtsH
MECLDKISDYLFEHETITGKEFMSIFREIKGIPDPEEKKEPERHSLFDDVKDPQNVVTDSIFDE